MSKADELLRELAAVEDTEPVRCTGSQIHRQWLARHEAAWNSVRAYLNEKPHEPICAVHSATADKHARCTCPIAPICPNCGRYNVTKSTDDDGLPIKSCEDCGEIWEDEETFKARAASPPHAAADHSSGFCPECKVVWRGTFAETAETHLPTCSRYAAEPEKPVAWMYTFPGVRYDAKVLPAVTPTRWTDPGNYTETPLYASPSAQPDTRKALEVLVAAIKPLNPGAPESNEVEAVISKAAIIYANFVLLLTASPAQPIAREPTGKMLRAMHNALAIAGGWVNDETLTAMWRAALKSAGKE